MNRTAMLVGVLLALLLALAAPLAHAALITVTAPGDPIVGLWNTTAGGNGTVSTVGTGSAGQYPAAEPPAAAIDNSLATKYLNFGTGGGSGVQSATKGVGTGFYVTPSMGPTFLKAFQIATANDHPARDPLSITLEGSNATGADLLLGSSWTLLYSGTTGLGTDPGRQQWGPEMSFTNTLGFSSYRLLVTSQRDVQNSVQYAEVRLLGEPVPEPSTVALLLLGAVGAGWWALRRR